MTDELQNGERRKENNEALATLKGATEAIVDLKTNLVNLQSSVDDAKNESAKRTDSLDRRQGSIRRRTTVTLVAVVLLGINGYFGHQILNRIDSCLNTSGKCYKKSQVNQSHIIQQVIDQNRNNIPDNIEILNQLREK